MEEQQEENVDVQKLKDLVRRLEKQNEHLRSRTGRLGGSTSKNSKTAKSYQTQNDIDEEDDELECVDMNALFTDDEQDETSWLYQSPVKGGNEGYSPEERRSSLNAWMTTELHNPSTPQYLAAKRNIISKLERTVPDFNLNFDSFTDFYQDGEFTEEGSDEDRENHQVSRSLKSQNSIDNEIASPKSNSSWSDEHNNHHDDVMMTSSHRSPSPNRANLSLHHHLPIPSQTMTSAYGLVASSELDRSSIRRSLTPPKYDVTRQQTPEQLRNNSTTPTSRPSSRRSLPAANFRKNLSGTRSASPNVQDMKKSKLATGKLHQPLIRSSIASPLMTSSSQQQERKNANPTAPSNGQAEEYTFQRSSTFTLSGPQQNSNKKQLPKRTLTSQSTAMTSSQLRRSLPRPSTTSVVTSSSKLRYGGGMTSSPNQRRQLTKRIIQPRRKNVDDVTTTSDIWTNDDEVF